MEIDSVSGSYVRAGSIGGTSGGRLVEPTMEKNLRLA